MPIKGALEAADHLPANAEVTVSCSPTLGIENTLALAEELLGRGFRVVPHLAARLVTGEGHLVNLLRRMEDSGLRRAVREILLATGEDSERTKDATPRVLAPATGAYALRRLADPGSFT